MLLCTLYDCTSYFTCYQLHIGGVNVNDNKTEYIMISRRDTYYLKR